MNKKKAYLYFFPVILIFIMIISWIVTIIRGETPYVDQWTRDFVAAVADSNLYTIARWITELGSESFLIPFTIIMAIILFFIFRDWLPVLFFAGGTLISHLLNMWIKVLVGRERPSIFIEASAEGFSFPSGHSMITMVCYGFLMYLLAHKVSSTKIKWMIQVSFSLLIFLVGISRYVINVHYLTDIIAGFMFGFIILIALIYLFEDGQKRRLRNQKTSQS